jgi:hypothetical protein
MNTSGKIPGWMGIKGQWYNDQGSSTGNQKKGKKKNIKYTQAITFTILHTVGRHVYYR